MCKRTTRGVRSSVSTVFNWKWNWVGLNGRASAEGEQKARGLTHLYIVFLFSLQFKFVSLASLSTPPDLAVIDCRTLWLGTEKNPIWGVWEEEMDLLTCDFDSGQCISACIMGNDETRCQGQLNIDPNILLPYNHILYLSFTFHILCKSLQNKTNQGSLLCPQHRLLGAKTKGEQ